MTPIYATWCISNNIGDALTPWLIEKITGHTPIYVPFETPLPKYMVTGSVLNHASDYTTVWGAGIAKQDDECDKDVNICTLLAVRGPLTAKRMAFHKGWPVYVVGDPALLLPRFIGAQPEKKYKVGICPHYVHQAEAQDWLAGRDDIKFINVFDTPEKFVADLTSCEVIYSSSLHGLVIADAYGVTSQWIGGTARLGGDGMKFQDHLCLREFLAMYKLNAVEHITEFIKTNPAEDEESMALLVKFTSMRPLCHLRQLPKDIDELRKIPGTQPETDFAVIAEQLWRVCPFKENSNG